LLLLRFTPPSPTQIYPLSLHDALPILKSTDIEAEERLRLQKTNSLCHTGMLPLSKWTNMQHQNIQTEKTKRQSMRPVVFQKIDRSEEHTSELQSRFDIVCRLLLEKKKN